MIKYYLSMDYEGGKASLNKINFPTEAKALESSLENYYNSLTTVVEAKFSIMNSKTGEAEIQSLVQNIAVELPETLYSMLDSLMPLEAEAPKNDKEETLEEVITTYSLDKPSFDKLIVLTTKIAAFNNSVNDFIKATTIKDMKEAGKKSSYIKKAVVSKPKEFGIVNCRFPEKIEEVSIPEME